MTCSTSPSGTRLLYFAYGSNMLTRRLARRVEGVRVVGPAWLPGYRLGFHKRGMDGSGKAVVAPAGEGDGVHGVLFELPTAARGILDRVEGGYRRCAVEVLPSPAELPPGAPAGNGNGRGGVIAASSDAASPDPDGTSVRALTYVAVPENLQDGLLPFCWYRDFVLHGAREHRLPEAWVRELEAVGVLPDPDPERLRGNRAILEDLRDLARSAAG